MKKSLLLVTLLLSSVAQAETYFCKTEIQALVNSVIVETTPEELKKDFVVDLSEGVKISGEDDYRGSCESKTLGRVSVIRCNDTLEYSTETLTIFLQSLEFTRIDDNYAYVRTTGGICTKI